MSGGMSGMLVCETCVWGMLGGMSGVLVCETCV